MELNSAHSQCLSVTSKINSSSVHTIHNITPFEFQLITKLQKVNQKKYNTNCHSFTNFVSSFYCYSCGNLHSGGRFKCVNAQFFLSPIGTLKNIKRNNSTRLNSNRVDQPGYEGSITERILHIEDKNKMVDNQPNKVEPTEELAQVTESEVLEEDKKMWKFRLFEVEMTPDTIAIASVYFVQGVLGLARLAVTFFLKDELHIDPAEATVLMGLSTFPWLIKPLYGFISDTIPLFGYKRRSYLILCGIVGALSWLTFATVVDSKYAACACIILSSLTVAVSDVVVDSMVVERARGESLGSAGALQSLCWGCSAIGSVTSAYFSGSLVQTYGPKFVFGVTSILPLITSFAGLLVIEKKIKNPYSVNFTTLSTNSDDPTVPLSELRTEKTRASENDKTLPDAFPNLTPSSSPIKLDDSDACSANAYGDKEALLQKFDQTQAKTAGSDLTLEVYDADLSAGQSQRRSNSFGATVISQGLFLWETIKQPSILLPTLFIFVWQATPQSDTAMFYFMTNKLDFDAEFLGRVRLVTSLASLAGVWVYNTYLKEVDLRKLFFWVTLLGTALGLSQLLLVTGANRALGINDQFFAIGDSLVLTVLGQVSFMPVLVLAARLCPEGVEATLFATLMSICNAAGVTGGLLGALLTQLMGVTSSDFDNLWFLILLCNLSSLLPLPFLYLLPAADVREKAEPDNEPTKEV